MTTAVACRVPSVAVSIFSAHVKRIGFARTAFGGGLMYLSVPFFIGIHLTLTLFLYRVLLRPMLRLPALRASNYIVLDRYNLAGLNRFDRFNCLFCEYANGTTTLLNAEIDQVAKATAPRAFAARLFVGVALVPLTILSVLGLVLMSVPTYFLVKALGLHRSSYKRIAQGLRQEGYANGHRPWDRRLVFGYKVAAQVIAGNLEQIESAWCPIKHLQRAGYVFPPHHTRFLDRDELLVMQDVLATRGTVSDRAPK